MNVLTIAALIVMAICSLRGWRRGFVMLLYGIAAWVFIAVFILIAHRFIYSYYLGNDAIYGKVYDFTRPYVNKYIPESMLGNPDVEKAITEAADALPEDVKQNDIRIDPGMLSDIDADTLKEYGIDVPKEYEGLVDDVLAKAAKNVENGSQKAGDLIEKAKEDAGEAGESLRAAMVDAATESAVQYILRAAAVVSAYLIAKIICVVTKIVLIVITERTPIR
ncbi:MAG: CvpA family protein, partial [Lachnospiraceae bacterium]|nr:CvpA family protein [Lachnospiraceae bacterium]